MRRWLFGLWLLGWLLAVVPGTVAPAAANAELDGSRRELGALRQQIDETLAQLRSKRSAAGSLSGELQKLEQTIGQLQGLIRGSSQRLAVLDRQLAEGQRELDRLRRELTATQQTLERRLVALYKGGQDGATRALLGSAASPLELAEKYAFLARVIRHDRELVASYHRQTLAVEQALAELQQLRDRQAELAAQRRQEQAALQSAGKAKQQLLGELRRDEARLATALRELRAKAARLADLVKKLERSRVAPYTGKATEFTRQRGQLPWPVAGTVRIGFGATRHPELNTLIDSNGLEIAAAPQTPIKAIWKGKLLYAGTLKGFGNLVIIDHGDKYYSLYAHAASFTRKVGDVVASGEVIAYSGHEGRDTIYFELRHQGVPVNPLPWLAPR